MKKLFILQAALLVSLAGCVAEKIKTDPQSKNDSLPEAVTPPPVGIDKNSIPRPRPRPPGSDKDAHGCTPSAGYLWCAKTNSCQRPRELAKKEGFIEPAGIYETRKAFNLYCEN